MVNYTCDRCKKTFNKKSNYETHINKKFKCDEVDESTIIIQKLQNENKELMKQTKKLTNVLKEENEERKKMQNEFDELKKMFVKLSEESKSTSKITNSNNTNSNNTTNSNNINQQNNIYITAFGKEDMSFVTEKLVKLLLKKGYEAVPDLIRITHFDDARPENHNVLLTRGDSTDISVHDGKDWIIKSKDEVIDQLVNDKTNFLKKSCDDHNLQNNGFDRYYDSYENDDNKMKGVKSNVRRICLSGKDKVKKVKKIAKEKK